MDGSDGVLVVQESVLGQRGEGLVEAGTAVLQRQPRTQSKHSFRGKQTVH